MSSYASDCQHISVRVMETSLSASLTHRSDPAPVWLSIIVKMRAFFLLPLFALGKSSATWSMASMEVKIESKLSLPRVRGSNQAAVWSKGCCKPWGTTQHNSEKSSLILTLSHPKDSASLNFFNPRGPLVVVVVVVVVVVLLLLLMFHPEGPASCKWSSWGADLM